MGWSGDMGLSVGSSRMENVDANPSLCIWRVGNKERSGRGGVVSKELEDIYAIGTLIRGAAASVPY